MITNIILASLTILGAIAFCFFLIIELIVEFVRDIKGDKMGQQIQILEDNGYTVEVEKGIIYIVLDSKDYFNLKARDKVKDLMKNYSKSYGLRLKETDND